MSNSDNPGSPIDVVQAQSELALLIGFCIAQFAVIEESLAALFAVAAQIPSIETSFRIHDEIREFQYRLGATDSAVRSWIDILENEETKDSLTSQWHTLRRDIKDDSEERNRIAHSRFAPNDNKDGTTTYFVCPYFQIYSHLSALKTQKGDLLKIPDGVRKYDAKSMEAKIRRFEKTSTRIDEFIAQLFAHGAPHPK